MARFTKAELTAAHDRYIEQAAEAVRTGDWNAWADRFTEDAVYVEHHYGTFHGREEIRAWIVKTMVDVPDMYFPWEWRFFDEDTGRVVGLCWNTMPDPDGNGPYRGAAWTLLEYAGDGLWSYEEDMYNPAEFQEMLGRWVAAGGGGAGGGSATT
jgi:uncharacterized protein (TIGR02246 family)